MHIIAVIPAYEPDEQMLPLLKEATEKGFDVIVVNDGSQERFDGVFEEAAQYAKVLGYRDNRGKGEALKHAFRYIEEKYEPPFAVVTMDSDGQHRLSDAQKLCEYMTEHPGELVLGSRQQSKDSPFRSRLGNGFTRLVYRLVAGVKVYDTQTGLRAFSSDLLPLMTEIRGSRYEYEMNVLMVCARRRIAIHEIPIETIYFDDNAGSHYDTVRDSLRIFREILRFCSSSLIGFLVDYLLYSLLVALLGTARVTFCNIAARVVSASVNFTLNRRFVFTGGDKQPLWSSLLRYAALAVCILALNTLLLNWLTQTLGWNPYLSKILVEVTLFLLSWFVQRNFVYYRKKKVQNAE